MWFGAGSRSPPLRWFLNCVLWVRGMPWILGFKRHNIIWILELDLQVKAASIAILTATLKELRCKTILRNRVSLEFGNFVYSDSVLQLNSHFIHELQRSCSNCEAYSIWLGTVSKPNCSVSRCAPELWGKIALLLWVVSLVHTLCSLPGDVCCFRSLTFEEKCRSEVYGYLTCHCLARLESMQSPLHQDMLCRLH